jgi:hypothetical protein
MIEKDDIIEARALLDLCAGNGSAVYLWRGEIHITGAKPSGAALGAVTEPRTGDPPIARRRWRGAPLGGVAIAGWDAVVSAPGVRYRRSETCSGSEADGDAFWQISRRTSRHPGR